MQRMSGGFIIVSFSYSEAGVEIHVLSFPGGHETVNACMMLPVTNPASLVW